MNARFLHLREYIISDNRSRIWYKSSDTATNPQMVNTGGLTAPHNKPAIYVLLKIRICTGKLLSLLSWLILIIIKIDKENENEKGISCEAHIYIQDEEIT